MIKDEIMSWRNEPWFGEVMIPHLLHHVQGKTDLNHGISANAFQLSTATWCCPNWWPASAIVGGKGRQWHQCSLDLVGCKWNKNDEKDEYQMSKKQYISKDETWPLNILYTCHFLYVGYVSLNQTRALSLPWRRSSLSAASNLPRASWASRRSSILATRNRSCDSWESRALQSFKNSMNKIMMEDTMKETITSENVTNPMVKARATTTSGLISRQRWHRR